MSLSRAHELFTATFGTRATWGAAAPGRVNLIGEHTDYNKGFVFPVAIDRELWIVAEPTNGPTTLVSEIAGPGRTFDVMSVEPGQLGKDWTRYVAGMGWVLRSKGPLPNIRAAVVSDVPLGSGVSSSAAIELAFAVLWNAMADLRIPQRDLALEAQRCENKFVGLNCGIMDQMASAMGRAGHAMFLDTASLDIRYAPIPADVSIVLCNTGKPRNLTEGEYNRRVEACEKAAKELGVQWLRDASMQDLIAKRGTLDDVTYRRALHVISEDERSLAFAEALDRGDLDALGPLMAGSHHSLKVDYEVSCEELDGMAEAASSAPGCLGVRMTGAGFGGACVALVRTSQLSEFAEATMKAFAARPGSSQYRSGTITACAAADGARMIEWGSPA